MKKYFLTILLSIFLFPIAVYADDYVAQIGETKYTSIQDAINAVTVEYISIDDQKNKEVDNTQVIKLLSDVSTITIPANKAVVINLNTHTVNGVENNGALSMYDGKIDNNGTASGIQTAENSFTILDSIVFTSRSSKTLIRNNAYLYIKNCSKDLIDYSNSTLLVNAPGGETYIYNSNFYTVLPITNYGIMKISKTDIKSSEYFDNALIYNIGNLIIKDGNFISEHNSDSSSGLFINGIAMGGTIQIDGGTYKGKFIATNEGHFDENKIIVNGGTFTSFREAFINFEEFDENSKNSIIINGGTINSETTDYILRSKSGTNTKNGTNDSISILGGTINANNSKGIYTCDNKLVIGNKDKIDLKQPEINIKAGNIVNCDNSATELEFYGGIINSKNSIYDKDTNKLKNVKTLENYIAIDELKDGYYKNYISVEGAPEETLPDKVISETIVNNPTTDADSKEEEAPKCRYDKVNKKYYNTKGEEIKKEDWENQCTDPVPTGSFIPYVAIISGLILAAVTYIITNKKTLLRKI